jgi:two-component system cell cycle sensor histidine kinase/response regulator CckA
MSTTSQPSNGSGHTVPGTTESESRFRRLFEAARDGILILEAAGGTVVDVNPFLLALTGRSHGYFLGKHLWELGAPEDEAASRAAFARLITDRYVRYEDLPLQASDGHKIDVEFVSNLYRVDDRDEIQCNIRDITARKRTESELRFRNLILQTQQETSIDGILVVDGSGKVVSSNARFAEMWRIPAAIMSSRSDERALRAITSGLLDPKEFGALVQRLYSDPTAKSRDEIALKDGRVFDRYSAPMLDADGHYFGRVWYFRDISEIKRAAALRETLEEQIRASQKMEAIGGLAGGVAHDFNNLLLVILSYTAFALDSVPEGAKIRADLLEVRKAAERAAGLTRHLLAFSRKQVLQPVSLDLNRIATGIEKMLRRILGEDVDFVLRLAPDLGRVHADPGQIEQVLMNLAVNARDAMPQGGKLTIETSNVEVDAEYAASHLALQPGSYVQLAVTDNGCGMSEQTRARIFEPFFTTKEKGKGTGLGLSTVYGIVTQSGGNVWVYSEPGHGTTFTIYLPRGLSAVATTPGVARPAEPRVMARGSEIILAVEDEEALRGIVRRILEGAGYTVLTAATGEEALAVAEAHAGAIDLLLADVVMPRMSGKALAQSLVALRPQLKVLYMSGYTNDAIVHRGVLEADTNFLGKPFTTAELTRKVREVLDGHVEVRVEERAAAGQG